VEWAGEEGGEARTGVGADVDALAEVWDEVRGVGGEGAEVL
jgi:hypothetical protein